MSDKSFSLQWNDFHSNLSEGFHSLLKAEDFVDVTLAADNKYIQAHRLVLSVCSPYFKDLFKVNPCKHPTVILKGVRFQELMDILEFMYRGQVSVQQDGLADFLKTAEMLQVKGLCENDASPMVMNQCIDKKLVKKDRTNAVWPDEASSPPLKRRRQGSQARVLTVAAPIDDQIMVSKSYDDDNSNEVEFVNVLNPKVEDLEEGEDEDEFSIEEGEIDHNSKSNFSHTFNESEDFITMQNTSDSQFDSDFPCGSQTIVGGQGGDQGQATFIHTAQGNLQLVHNGYLFGVDRTGKDRFFWKCSNYHKSKCRARMITVGTDVIVKCPEHNHVPDWNKIARTKLRLKASSMFPFKDSIDIDKKYW